MQPALSPFLAQRPLSKGASTRIAPKTLPPRLIPAALRVPHPRHAEQELALPWGLPRLFVHEGARQSLERRLAAAHRKPVLLAVTDNCRSMISHARKNGFFSARIHHMFLDAPAHVKDALVRFLVHRDRDASAKVGQFIAASSHRIRASRPVRTPLVTHGASHDLLAIFNELNARYFGGSVDALISWGRRVRGSRKRSIKLGTYSAVERLIRIHPALDRRWVPRYFVAFVVYHEMLHHLVPAQTSARRKLLHSPAFQAREREFTAYERATNWERRHLSRLLRA